MEKQRWICHEWHSFLGLGPFPVPDAIQVVRATGSMDEREAIKSAISAVLPELSRTIAAAVLEQLQGTPMRAPLMPTTPIANVAGQAGMADGRKTITPAISIVTAPPIGSHDATESMAIDDNNDNVAI
ncbi:hypothetical protein J3R83DRAFT_4394 [Lanmaoa asiatica]|nr:hypothetical protein J3R83DRAFT_4394 [Lanmaoa asiatica]